jgi:excisionase family DNA binding protein
MPELYDFQPGHDISKRWLSRKEASAYLGIGTTKLDVLIAANELPSFLLGSKRIVPVAGIIAYEARRLAEAGFRDRR